MWADYGAYLRSMRFPLALLVVLVVFAAGTTFAMATGTGGNGNNGTPGHKEKPGCGPDKTDGVAGASGQHLGQPPKADNRQDCPNPPGQQGNTNGNSNKSSSSATTSSTSSSNKKK